MTRSIWSVYHRVVQSSIGLDMLLSYGLFSELNTLESGGTPTPNTSPVPPPALTVNNTELGHK